MRLALEARGSVLMGDRNLLSNAERLVKLSRQFKGHRRSERLRIAQRVADDGVEDLVL
jgi:hypothetical protein